MLVTEANVAALGGQKYDVAIIGAGIVGLFCAIQLEKHGFRVAVVEGGKVTPDTMSNARYTAITGRAHSSTESGRAMGLGGTGLLWGGQLSEFGPDDVESGKGFWPIPYGEIRALYDRVYAALGLPPRLDDAAARAALGGDEGVIDGVERIFSYWLPDPNLAGVFRDVITRSDALTVFPCSKAVGLDFEENGRAHRVNLQTPSGPASIAVDTVVLAAGVLESVRFVLATKREPNCPWRGNVQIGAAFQDHLGGEMGNLIVKDERLFRDRFETGFIRKTKYMPKLRFVEGKETHAGATLSICAFPIFRSNLSEHIANLKLLLKSVRTGAAYSNWRQLPTSALKIGTAFVPLVSRYIRERRVLAIMDQGVGLAFQCEQQPRSDSLISLVDDYPAADGLPRILLDWRTGIDEPTFLLAAAQRYAGYFGSSGVADLCIDPSLLEDAPAFVARLRDTSHPSGGLCMGNTPVSGATDGDGRIWSSPNVFAAGASVLTTSGEANITLSALALALRLVDHLVAKRRSVSVGRMEN